MRQQKPKDCFHKIVTFQVHKDCHEFAAICQNTCQKIHRANFPPCTVPMNVIQDHFSQIKNRLIEVMKVYSFKLSKEYEWLLKDFQRRHTENLREMQKEMLSVLIRVTNMNKDVLDKIENQRLEKLKCSEVYSYLQDKKDFQARIKSAPLQPIYQKHLYSLKSNYKQLCLNPKNQQNAKSSQPLPSNSLNNNPINTSQDPTQKTKKTDPDHNSNKQKQEKSVAPKMKKINKQNLKIKTWDIVKVITEKRKKKQAISKNQSQNKPNKETNELIDQKRQIIQTKKPNIVLQVAEVQQAQNNRQDNQNIIFQRQQNEGNNSESDDFIDFIQKRKNQV